jgi:hypothetical protein
METHIAGFEAWVSEFSKAKWFSVSSQLVLWDDRMRIFLGSSPAS